MIPDKDGYYAHITLPNGREVSICALLYGTARMLYNDPMSPRLVATDEW